MARRGTFNRSGHILDAPTGVDPSSWAADNLLTKTKPVAAPLACQCRPSSGPTDLGGCKPGLRWVSHDLLAAGPVLAAYCRLCRKSLLPGVHKRRSQLWVIGLAELYATSPENVDLDSVSDLFEPYNGVGQRAVTPDPRPNQLELD